MRLGVQIPEFVDKHIESISETLKNCCPYDEWDCAENEALFDTSIASAKEILRFMVKVKHRHRKGF